MEETIETTLKVEVKIKTMDAAKGKLADVIAAGAKLTKADAGKAGTVIEDSANVIIEAFDTKLGFTFPKVEIAVDFKLSIPEIVPAV